MTSPLDVLRADPDWSALYDRIESALVNGGAEARDDPGPPPAGPGVLERYARAVTDSSSPEVSLAISFPMVLCAASVACQGAYWLRVRQPGGGWLEVPGILQATLIAPSGYGKSSSLGPVVKMLDRLDGLGKVRRRAVAEQLAEARVLADGLTGPAAQAVMDTYLAGGECQRLTIDSGTPEGIRNALLVGGSAVGILTSEPDILREIGGYSKDGGTFRYFLDGWDANKIGVARATGGSTVPRAAVPYCIVVQPMAFDHFNASRIEKDGGQDSAIGRGLYGRSWLVRVGSNNSGTLAYGMRRPGSMPGAEIADLGELANAADGMERALAGLLQSSDAYRARMGVWIADGGRGDLPGRIWLGLADDAMVDYSMLQNLRLALNEMVCTLEAERPGLEAMFNPLTARITQHALRLALVQTLADNPAAVEISAGMLRDACLRLLPWLVEHWAREMGRYAADLVVMNLEQEIRRNPYGAPLTFEGRMEKALAALVRNSEMPRESVAFYRAQVLKRAADSLRGENRLQLRPGLEDAWDGWIRDGLICEVPGTGGGGQRGAVRYKVTPEGIRAGLGYYGAS